MVQIARTPNIMQKSVAHEDLRIRRGVWRLRVRKVSRQDRQGLLIDVAFVDDSDTGRRGEPPTNFARRSAAVGSPRGRPLSEKGLPEIS